MPAKKKTEENPFDTEFDVSVEDEPTAEAIDLTAVPDKVQYELLPPGTYNGIVENVEYRTSSKGNPMLSWTVEVTENGKKFKNFSHTVLTGNGLVRTKKVLSNLLPHAPGGESFDPKKFDPDKAGEIFIGTPCRVKLEIDVYNGEKRNQTKEILPPSTSDDDFLG